PTTRGVAAIGTRLHRKVFTVAAKTPEAAPNSLFSNRCLSFCRLSMALGKHFVAAARLSAALVLLGAAAVLCADLPARAEPEPMVQATGPSIRAMRVVDGATVENTASGVVYRLDNIDAPADGDAAACAAERDEGARATAAAEQLVGRARALIVA